MGGRRIRPAADSVCCDALWIAEQIGRPVVEVYRLTRAGVLPPPVAGAMARRDPAGRPESPQNWRWSKARILAHLEGVVTDGDPTPHGGSLRAVAS